MRILLVICLALTRVVTSAQNDSISLPDTAAISKTNEKVVKEVIASKLPPKSDKLQYVSELTKYGFKNLFNQFRYNPSLPYDVQVNPHAELFMQDYLRNHGSSLIKMKAWAVPYFNLIDNILSKYGLPTELKYLAVIESNLKSTATSWVGAVGPWQFMSYTAKEYGLRINNNTDERRDYFKSTHAAARFLLNLYNQMQDWLLVIAAYNGGPGAVNNAIKKSGSSNFWKLQYYLPEESRNHVKKFIATHYVMESALTAGSMNYSGFFQPLSTPNTQNGNHPNLSEQELKETEKQTISGKYNSTIIAKYLGIHIQEFNKYNPLFDERLGRNGEYDLILPKEKMQLFLSEKYQILNECVEFLLSDNPIKAGPDTKMVYPNSNKKKKKAT